MNSFTRFMRGFMSLLTSSKAMTQSDIAIMGRIEEQKIGVGKVQKALSRLIYERKLAEVRISDLEKEGRSLAKDLELALAKDRDDLAIEVMKKSDKVAHELDLYRKQFKQLLSDIEEIKETGASLVMRLRDSSAKAELLKSRRQMLSVRKELSRDMTGLRILLDQSELVNSPFDRELTRIDAEAEALELSRGRGVGELGRLRSERDQQVYRDRLKDLKNRVSDSSVLGWQPSLPSPATRV